MVYKHLKIIKLESKSKNPRGFILLSRNANIANVNKPAFW